MKKVPFTLVCLLSMLPLSAATLSDYKWKNRVILLKGNPESRDYQLTRKKLDSASDRLDERDVVVLEESSPNLTLSLYGKDGGKKWEGGKDFEVGEITSLIDSMPMRQSEMKE